MTWSIRIAKWSDFQHYRKPHPAWVKLYRKTLDKRAWRGLPASAAKLLVDLWMLAAEADKGPTEKESGEINMPLEDIAWRLRLGLDSMRGDLQLLARDGFVELSPLPSRSTIEEGETEPRPEERRDRDRRETDRSASPNWVAPFCEAWDRRFAGTVPGARIGAALKPLRKKYPDVEILARWVRYLEQPDGKFLKPEIFASTFADWDGTAKTSRPDGTEFLPGEDVDQYIKRHGNG